MQVMMEWEGGKGEQKLSLDLWDQHPWGTAGGGEEFLHTVGPTYG